MNLFSYFSNFAKHIENFFGSHQSAIQTGIADVQVAVAAAAGIAGAVGEKQIVPVLGEISDGLHQVSQAVAADATADNVGQQAQVLIGLASNLVVKTNDVGVKDAGTKAAIGGIITKIGSVSSIALAASASITPLSEPLTPAPVTPNPTATPGATS